MKPINPNAKWKKLFSREYGVQYTEVSLHSLSNEVKGLAPFTFFEQIYVPEENNQACFVDENKWAAFLNKIQTEWVRKDVKKFQKLFFKIGKEYVDFAKKVAKLNLRNKDSKELIEIYSKYQRLCVRYTLFIWAAYFLNDFCAERARQLIQKKLKDQDPHTYVDAIFSPLKKAAILELTRTVSAKDPLTKKEIKLLFEKYKWIPCLDLHNQPWTFEEFKEHLKDFKKKERKQEMTYKQALENLAVNKEEKKILDNAKLFAYFKDLRDDFRRQGIFYIQNSLFKELANRLSTNIRDMAYLQENEIVKCLEKGIGCDKNLIEERKKGFVIFYDSNKKIICISGHEIKNALIKLELIKEESKADLRGTPASKGIAKGKVAIVKGVKDLPNVQKGDILVAITTHPDYVPAMQKAVAIVTDEGGVTSHAAIVSRELGIPCIVGTKTATNILQNGDFIEANGNTGLARILKKKA